MNITRRNTDAERRELERAAGLGDDQSLGRLVNDRIRKGDLTLDFLLLWTPRVNQFLTIDQRNGMRQMLSVQGDPIITVVGEDGEVGIYREDGFVRWVWEVLQEYNAPELSVDEAVDLARSFRHEVTRSVPTIHTISADEGLDVSVFRGDDGMIVVQIDTHLEEADLYSTDAPMLRVNINDESFTTAPHGGWEGQRAPEEEEEPFDTDALVQEILDAVETDEQITEIVDAHIDAMNEAQFLAVLRVLGDRDLGLVPPDLSGGWDSALRQLAFNALEAAVGERWSAQEDEWREQQADNWARHPHRELRDREDEDEDED